MPDAEWGGPPEHQDALLEPPQTAGWDRSLAVSQRLLGTPEIILIHHTDCGLQKITDDEFTREIEEETGIRPPWAVQAFTDAAWDVRESIGRLKASPFLPRTDKIRGFVFDVATGKLNKVR